jgi:nucleoside-diphosphate-sugar epimerase
MILLTGAAGQVGRTLLQHLRSAGHSVLATDIRTSGGTDVVRCDLRSGADIASLFQQGPFSTVVHLAGILPTAYRSDPLTGADVNLSGTLRLLGASLDCGVARFVFGSSSSVYGNSPRDVCSEISAPAPDDPYGAAKLAIEKVLEQLCRLGALQGVSLRIARVLGPGATGTGSPWRSQFFERPPRKGSRLTIPFASDAVLSAIHVEELARALRTLVETPHLSSNLYNAPAEHITAARIRKLAEAGGWQVVPGASHGGPRIDGTRFCQEFGFTMRPLEEYLCRSEGE